MSDTPQLTDFLVGPDVDAAEAQEYVRSLQHAPVDSIEDILRSLMQHLEVLVHQYPTIVDDLLRLLQSNLLRQPAEEASRLDVDLIVAIYENLPQSVATRFLLLHSLAIAGQPEHLRALTQQLIADPPATWIQAGLVLSPLFQKDAWQVNDLFPEILDSLQHTTVAGGVIDLANRLQRTGRVEVHPAAERSDQLIALFSGLTSRLEQIEKKPQDFGDTPEQVNHVLSESIGLTVSLCDALALIGDEKAKSHLENAMQLSHRRIQTEAAGALAMFGEDSGRQRLVALAAEPSARLRVLAYASELGMEDQIDEAFKTPASQAESELALWLAQPTQMSVPPSSLELLDERTQYWPGFEKPVECFLFRFEYALGTQVFGNIGIAGPMVHAFTSDLTSLSTDDAYAAFAGWQAEHNDIYEVDREHWNEGQRQAAEEFAEQLNRDGYEDVVPQFLAFLFGEFALIGKARLNESAGAFATDGLETVWLPATSAQPLGLADACNIFRGRRMLRTFNV